MLRVAVVGAGGHGKVVADALLVAGQSEFVGFLDDDEASWGSTVLGFPVRGPVVKWSARAADGLALGVGNNSRRCRVFQQLVASGVSLITVVHPRAVMGRGVRLGQGVVALANVVVNCDSLIGDNVILNTACSIDHDNAVAAHAHLAPGARTAGGVRIGEGAFVGMGAVILPNVSIGDWAIVAAGAVVTRDVKDGATVVGVPARTV